MFLRNTKLTDKTATIKVTLYWQAYRAWPRRLVMPSPSGLLASRMS